MYVFNIDDNIESVYFFIIQLKIVITQVNYTGYLCIQWYCFSLVKSLWKKNNNKKNKISKMVPFRSDEDSAVK